MTQKEWRRIFSRTIRIYLLENGMTQEDLAYMAGIRQSNISRYIRELQTPTLMQAINLARAMEVNLDELCNYGDWIDG